MQNYFTGLYCKGIGSDQPQRSTISKWERFPIAPPAYQVRHSEDRLASIHYLGLGFSDPIAHVHLHSFRSHPGGPRVLHTVRACWYTLENVTALTGRLLWPFADIEQWLDILSGWKQSSMMSTQDIFYIIPLSRVSLWDSPSPCDRNTNQVLYLVLNKLDFPGATLTLIRVSENFSIEHVFFSFGLFYFCVYMS